MSLNWKELENQVADVAPIVKGSVVQKIAQTGQFAGGEAVVFHGFSHAQGAWRLVVSMRGNFTFFGFLGRDMAVDNSKDVSTFIMVLRKHFLGVRIERCVQLEGERILRLDFENEKVMIFDLIPRRGNILAMEDWDESDKSGRCLASFRKVSLAAGARYQMPEAKIFEVKDVRDFSEEAGASYGERVVRHFYTGLTADSFEVERQAWVQSVKSAQKKLQVAITNFERDASKVEKSDDLKEQALILSEKLFELGPKNYPQKKQMEIEALSDGRKVKVNLDPSLNFSDNADKMFRQVKKLSRAGEELADRMQVLRKKAAALDELNQKILSAENRETLLALENRLAKFGISTPKIKNAAAKKVKAPEAKEYLELRSSDGFTILCGRNQNENRAVTFHGAIGSDVWMHLKGVPGAHVVIKAQKNKTVPLNTLLEAAQLTLYYSKVRDGKKADVDYTYRKNVKAIKGTTADVTYTDNKTIYVEADGEVVRKLLRLAADA